VSRKKKKHRSAEWRAWSAEVDRHLRERLEYHLSRLEEERGLPHGMLRRPPV
jgi:hypothetical protein